RPGQGPYCLRPRPPVPLKRGLLDVQPDVQAAGSTGLYHDRRSDEDDRTNTTAFQFSHDAGASFRVAVQVSDRGLPPRPGGAGPGREPGPQCRGRPSLMVCHAGARRAPTRED
ncbi:MAG TPA: hypothetical protein VFO65_07190, partial [Acidimicrobiales bacterium]|nr:hypothetical protein [Acidimicrobiales bacterium]